MRVRACMMTHPLTFSAPRSGAFLHLRAVCVERGDLLIRRGVPFGNDRRQLDGRGVQIGGQLVAGDVLPAQLVQLGPAVGEALVEPVRYDLGCAPLRRLFDEELVDGPDELREPVLADDLQVGDRIDTVKLI